MLMQCGLGLWEMALLHLVAHSLYKAHAFLTAGETVTQARLRDLEPASASSPLAQLLALPFALAVAWATAAGWAAWMPGLQVPPIALLLLATGLAPLLWGQGARARLLGAVALLGLVHLYLAWHLAFAALLPPRAAGTALPAALWVAACFAALYALQAWLRAFPQGQFSRRFYPWAYGGFYLDERFTRFTFRIWPARLDGTRTAP
jgi:NAD(P)H-quinone oxidoreductase subunit 5